MVGRGQTQHTDRKRCIPVPATVTVTGHSLKKHGVPHLSQTVRQHVTRRQNDPMLWPGCGAAGQSPGPVTRGQQTVPAHTAVCRTASWSPPHSRRGRETKAAGSWSGGFPDGSLVQKPQQRHGFNPWVGKIPWRREWLPTLVFLLG